MATTTDPDEVDLGELSREAHAYARSGRRRFMLALASLSSALVAKEPVDIPTWVTANLFMPAEKTTRGGPIVLTPIQAAIARFWQTPGVEQVTFLKPPRIGSSFINGAGLLYYACHEAQDVIFYERSEQTAQEFNNDKLMPVLRSSVSVSGLIRPDSKTGEQDRWTDRMLMNGAGLKLRSVSNNGAFRGIRGRFICADEAGSPEYNASGKRTEGSKVDLIKRRGQEFADFVLYIGGTPTRTGECNVSAEFAKSDKREFVMAAPCCGHRQPFKPDVRPSLDPSLTYGPGLRYTVDDRGVPNDAWYECASCGERIEETSKVDMMATGVFEATTIGDRGHVGVYVNSMHSTDPRSTWKHVAQAHVAMVRDPGLTQTFWNMWLALPYDPAPPTIVDIAKLQENVLELPPGIDCPEDTVFLVASIDNQEGRSDDPDNPPRGEMTVVAIRENRRDHVVLHRIVSHLVVDRMGAEARVGFNPFSAEYADEVWSILDRDYVAGDGRLLRIRRCAVDVGWNTEAGHKFCMLPRSRDLGIVPIRGDTTERANRKVTLLPKNGALRKSKASGRSYLWIGTRDAKDEVARRMEIPAPAPGSYTFAPDLPDSYFQGLLAQRLVELKNGQRVWSNVGSGTGEPWDCLQYAYAMRELVVMKSKRLREKVDSIDPLLAQAALEARIAAETPSSTPVEMDISTLEEPPLQGSGPTDDPPAEEPSVHVDLRTRIAEKKKRQTEMTPEAEKRLERIKTRRSRKGIGW